MLLVKFEFNNEIEKSDIEEIVKLTYDIVIKDNIVVLRFGQPVLNYIDKNQVIADLKKQFKDKAKISFKEYDLSNKP